MYLGLHFNSYYRVVAEPPIFFKITNENHVFTTSKYVTLIITPYISMLSSDWLMEGVVFFTNS
jgi:hypothetical protein